MSYISSHAKYKNIENNTTMILLKLRENHQKFASLIREDNPAGLNVESSDNKFESDYISWLRDRDNQNMSVEAKWKTKLSIIDFNNLYEINNKVLETLSAELEKN